MQQNETVTFFRVVQVLFANAEMKDHKICKIDIKKLNWKLQKLQAEGMKILGVYFEDTKVHSTPRIEGAVAGKMSFFKTESGDVKVENIIAGGNMK